MVNADKIACCNQCKQALIEIDNRGKRLQVCGEFPGMFGDLEVGGQRRYVTGHDGTDRLATQFD